MSAEATVGVSDLVIVGGGPRALYALADLDDALARIPPAPGVRPLRVTVLEVGVPGAGAVWEPTQPEHLLMNVDSRIVDASCASVPLSFRQWHAGAGGSFPPRAEVGRYLAWSFERLSESPRIEIIHRPLRATAVRRDRDGWVCTTADADATTAAPESSPRVLIATGHAGGAGIDHAAVADASRGPRPGATVVVRGASLTAFDVVMDLTAGRGGAWVPDAAADSGLRYVAAGSEPSSITLVSRSGEPMLPKPVSNPSAVTAAVRARTSQWAPHSTPDEAWWEVLAQGAMDAAVAAGTKVTRDDLFARLGRGASEASDSRWALDVNRALGDVDGDPAWWWGRAWSAGYADVVRSLERAPREQASWSLWRARAATLERWAFGPPLVTHRRLLALRDSGLLAVVPGAEGADIDPGAVVIGAFTRGAGVLDAPQSWDGVTEGPEAGREPWGALVDEGHATVRPGERGVLTARDATCIGAEGDMSEGLAALGRPTEDPVIGHDSLQRRLHGDSVRWAEGVASEWLSVDGVASELLTRVGHHD